MSTILDALKKKYEAEIEEGKVNIKIMLNNPISIPEHSKFLEELDVHFGKIAEAEDKLEASIIILMVHKNYLMKMFRWHLSCRWTVK